MDSTTINRPQRWDNPFGAMSQQDIAHILSIEPFSLMDPNRFPKNLKLEDIIRNDTRIVDLEEGDVVVREGDYGNSAFIILSGDVNVIMPNRLPPQMLGRGEQKNIGFFNSVSQLWNNAKYPEVRNMENQVSPDSTGDLKRQKIFLQDIADIISDKRIVTLERGHMIGEIAALSRSQRTTTLISASTTKLLEIRWQGLRDIRKRAKEFRDMVDQLYRKNSLESHLESIPLFQHLSDAQMEKVTEATIFETYGNFEWYSSFKQAHSHKDYSSLSNEEPIIVSQGNYMDGLLMVRSGFARMSYQVNHSEKTIGYLGKGAVFSLESFERSRKEATARYSLRALGYTDMLRLPTNILEEVVLPKLPSAIFKKYMRNPKSHASTRVTANARDSLVEHMIERRFINGTSTMIIDLDRCTRCDECVTACATAHDNNPRFVRHGTVHNKLMVVNACMQCQDPVCMIGCPTGAIHHNVNGVVSINEDTCIGCSVCAEACPYDNIRMAPIRDSNGQFILDNRTNTPITKATKCDLCQEQLGGPACERACPHDALARIDMHDLAKLVDWVDR